MRLVALFMLFLFLSAFFIISNENLALKDKDARMEFGRAYYIWVLGIFGNVKSISGYVIKAEWLPDRNITNKSK